MGLAQEFTKQVRAATLHVGVQVPSRQYRAGRADTHVSRIWGAGIQCYHGVVLTQFDQVVPEQLPGVVLIAEHALGEGVESEDVSPQPVAAIDTSLYHCQARAGAQRALIAHPVSLDERDAHQRFIGVAQPVAVVGVGDVISAEQVGLFTGAQQAGCGRIGVGIPFAATGITLVCRPAKYAITQLLVGKIHHRTQVPIQNLAAAVCRNSVRCGGMLALIQRCFEVPHIF